MEGYVSKMFEFECVRDLAWQRVNEKEVTYAEKEKTK
jgi:hypothetical protein